MNFPDLDHEKLNWNRHILLNFLPKLYCKLLKDVIELQKSNRINLEYHPVMMFWPFPSHTRNHPKYAFEYGCKVLQLILKDEDITRSINDGSSDEVNNVDALFKLLSRQQISGMRDLLRVNWNGLSINPFYIIYYLCNQLSYLSWLTLLFYLDMSDQNLKSMISSLPIWPIATQQCPRPLISASCGHILSSNIKHYRTKNSIKFLDTMLHQNDWNIFIILNVPSVSVYSYIFDHVDFPNESDDEYIKFLKSVIELNDQTILHGLKEKSCFPHWRTS